ncbi:calsyntenin-1-like isoform X2 [Tubulanus polymorphus]|uniref:calsyntenin-1-like isoform X2 n=1 Tax=Tubulanus polymorphus TaxID=672921 RepID=UPI003DA66E2D
MYRIAWCSALLGILCLGFVSATSEPVQNDYAPELVAIDKKGNRVRAYHGVIRENERLVQLDPPLRATDKDEGSGGAICGYVIQSVAGVPFEIELKNHITGEAIIKLEPGKTLDAKKNSRYTFDVAAYDCGSPLNKISESPMPVHIKVVEYPNPRWDKDAYRIDLEEGTPQPADKPLVSVRARESRVDDEGNICDYRILTPDVPFKVDNRGNIRLKTGKKISYDEHHNFIIAVVATDCSGRESKPVMVTFKIVKACVKGWKGIATDPIKYRAGSGRLPFAKDARFDMCKTNCTLDKASIKISLGAQHIGKGCDRDTYSIQSQRHLCGAHSEVVDLLPSANIYNTFTKSVPHDEGADSDKMFRFDGETTHIVVPDGMLSHQIAPRFTIMMWMMHGGVRATSSKHGAKEQILCSSDGMNRHHYSLYIHNCRLVLLLRQEYAKDTFNVFKPAEWRWKLPEVCDGKWHHYAVSMDFPQVRLYVDGQMFVENKKNPEVVDDWPLHQTKSHSTKLVVGACWQGAEKKMHQFFKGYLAGLSVLPKATETNHVIRCLTTCAEKLDFHDIRMLEGGMTASYNSEMSQITLNSPSIEAIRKILNRIAYINYRRFPTDGLRNLVISTDVKCKETHRLIKIPDVRAQILVLDNAKPSIKIAGPPRIARNYNALAHVGDKIFSDIDIVVTTGTAQNARTQIAKNFAAKLFESKVFADGKKDEPKDKSIKPENMLDSCMVRVFPALKYENTERLIAPLNLIRSRHLVLTNKQDGLIISGVATVEHYKEILGLVHYINRHPQDINTKEFTVQCAILDGRFLSNEYTLKLEIIHEEHIENIVPHHAQKNMQYHEHRIEPDNHMSSISKSDKVEDAISSPATTVGTGVIIVVCVGFLIFMIVLGVIRIKTHHERKVVVEDVAEMDWDNSALNITVNPLEQEFNEFSELDTNEQQTLRDDSDSDDDDDDDDASSYRDEIDSSEDESPEKPKDRHRGELEWDDSTLELAPGSKNYKV